MDDAANACSASDVYSWAVMLNAVLPGRGPFEGVELGVFGLMEMVGVHGERPSPVCGDGEEDIPIVSRPRGSHMVDQCHDTQSRKENGFSCVEGPASHPETHSQPDKLTNGAGYWHIRDPASLHLQK